MNVNVTLSCKMPTPFMTAMTKDMAHRAWTSDG
jgi:hypothetical protein